MPRREKIKGKLWRGEEENWSFLFMEASVITAASKKKKKLAAADASLSSLPVLPADRL